MTSLMLLGGSVTLNATAQISLRYATSGRANFPPKSPRLWLSVWGLCFGLATILWLLAIRQTDLSYAYPILGAGYVLVTLLAKWLLDEETSALHWIAILIISTGVLIVGVNR